MIVSFYDREFNALLNNASLLIDKNSYNLIKRPIELNDFSCVCEPFTEDIQPTFLVVKDDRGNNKELVYSALAGVPILNKDNKTEINATDLKTLFSSDVIIQYGTYGNISQVINKIFTEWDNQVNKGSINCRIVFEDNAGATQLNNLVPSTEKQVYNALDEISAYLNAYDLYIDSKIDLIAKEVVFTIGKTMLYTQNIKLWEYGIKNYGKWVADVNETQGYFVDTETNVWLPADFKWILTSDNAITIDEADRDIYPIKRRIFISNESREQASKEALIELLNSRYNENIEIPATNLNVNFKTKFNIFVKDKFLTKEGIYYYDKNDIDFANPLGIISERQEVSQITRFYGTITLNDVKYIVKESDIENVPYKSLPCGELRYNMSGLYEVQIGFRYVGVDFI